MNANEKILNTFATRVRQLILQYLSIKKENNELYNMVNERDQEILKLQKQLAQSQSDYQTLKIARMIEVSDKDIEVAQKRVSKLIRDINKCITLLSDK
ncbi:hypothetical protein ABVC71_09635 [Prevotella amnii]|jgi:hypothetical protein|uniref:Uncharacterized protein n=3 Tax=Prevotella amnii TaxID=419005 RepID=A0A096AY71_9BACT|nr:hypothetical protein [Prevotella amnii]KGF52038.1 hypothetical protein HMPREF9302_05090 [Prevotella amnii DNF00058]KXB77803.1 hypothetical protein HMPREF1860_01257 [Prevotella amnii]